MRVLMRILLAHNLEALQVEVRQVLTVLAGRLFQCVRHNEIYKLNKRKPVEEEEKCPSKR
jgi:hypothetical protein